MKLIAVVAAGENGVIGRAGALPWHLPADLGHFKALTVGKPVVMGRKTFESIGRPLPNRVNVVVTRSGVAPQGCLAARSVDDALALPEVASAPEVMVIGGEQLFAEMLPRCDVLELTRVHASPAGDAFFRFDRAGWELVRSEDRAADEKNAHAMTFETWRRR